MRKFLGKIKNLALVVAPGSFRLLNKRHDFGKEQVFVQIHSPVFFSAEPVYQTITIFVLKSNIHGIHKTL